MRYLSIIICPKNIFLFIILTSYFYSHSFLFSLDALKTTSHERKWDIPTVMIKAISGEFQGLMADFLLMEAAVLFGTEVKKVKKGEYVAINPDPDLETITRLLKHSISLDPYFQQTYISAQGWLPWYGEPYITEANNLLKIAADARTWDWQPSRFIGFNTYFFYNNFGDAGKIFLEASKRKDAPSFLAILGARLAHKGHQTEAAIELLTTMLKDKTEDDLEFSDLQDRLHALEGVALLENAVSNYYKKHSNYPQNPDQLLKAGLLKVLPENPYDVDYCIDDNGMVHFDNPTCR